MWRFLAGAGSALLFFGAGVIWWANGQQHAPILSAFAPMARTTDAAESLAPPEANERTREQKRFDRYDKDRNGQVTTDEYLLSRRKAFAKLDLDGDGRLDFGEWAKRTTDKFAKADADGSRALSRAEFATTKVARKSPAKRDCPPPPPKDEEEG